MDKHLQRQFLSFIRGADEFITSSERRATKEKSFTWFDVEDLKEFRGNRNVQEEAFNSVFEKTVFTLNSKITTREKGMAQINLEKHTSELIGIINNDVFEAGITSRSEQYVEEFLDNHPASTMEWLNDLFLRFFHDPKILVGILHIISHFDYKKVYPSGQTIVLAALRHENVEVLEKAVSAFENWGSRESIRMLQHMKFNEEWLQEYVDQVIEDLEQEV